MAVLTKITSRTLADNSVTSAKISADVVGASDLAPNSVGASELADNAVDTDAIAATAVSAAKMATDTGIHANYHKMPTFANDSARNSAISSPSAGMMIYHTGEGHVQQYSGTAWNTVPDNFQIGHVEGTINTDTNSTLIAHGVGFISGMTVKLILQSSGADISGHTSLSYTLNSATKITITVPTGTTAIAAGTKVILHIAKAGQSIQSPVLTSAADPAFTTAAGSIASLRDTEGKSFALSTKIAATSATGEAITYATSNLDTNYFALNTSTGEITTHATTALTGIMGGGTSDVTDSFDVVATSGADANATETRAFSIIVKYAYDGSTPTRAGKSCWHIINQNAHNSSALEDGVYFINPDTGPSGNIPVWCDMTTDGGGWTMIMQTNSAREQNTGEGVDIFSSAQDAGPNAIWFDDMTIGPYATNDKYFGHTRNWESYHQNNAGNANNGSREFMIQKRKVGEKFVHASTNSAIWKGVTWLASNTSQNNLPGTGGNNVAYGYWSMALNATMEFGDGTTLAPPSGERFSMTSCLNDNSSCDDWHSTHVHNQGHTTRGYQHWGDYNHATKKMWGITYGTGTDPNSYSGAVWSRPDVAGNAGGTELNYGRSDGDREMGMSYWVRNKGTW